MKLAEALVQRADVQKKLAGLRERLNLSALVQEGERPPEDPQELFKQLDQLLQRLEHLVVQINLTNMQTRLADGAILTYALAQRDVLTLHYNTLNSLVEAASKRVDRYARSEIRTLSTVNIPALRQQMDQVARDRRELDTQIQAVNWATELIEEPEK